ncbi:MAG: hypothetical protein KDM64_13915 [Verrucomicrobiae bacterium]|nr:hypothetical protein [Verrucomicrobiae bacterium]
MHRGLALTIFVSLILVSGMAEEPRVTLYSPDSSHLWNRLHRAIWVRTTPDGTHHDGEDWLDAPLSTETRSVLEEGPLGKTLSVLDEFNRQTDEAVATIPALHRAWMQRALWSVFDWSVSLTTDFHSPIEREFHPRLRDLQGRLTAAIRLIALTKEEIDSLPDTYASTLAGAGYSTEPLPTKEEPNPPYLPSGLAFDSGDWTLLGPTAPSQSPAPVHFEQLSSRSVFLVALRIPKTGNVSSLDYLKSLNDFRPAWIPTEKDGQSTPTLPVGGLQQAGVIPNPETPQFPDGTQWALIRRAILISRDGALHSSPLVESIQVRTYLAVGTKQSTQALVEFVLSPRALFDGAPPVIAQHGTEFRFPRFLSHQQDPFENGFYSLQSPANEPSPIQLDCLSCHSGWGIHGVNSRSEFFRPRGVEPPHLYPSGQNEIVQGALRAKARRADWILLDALWNLNAPP